MANRTKPNNQAAPANPKEQQAKELASKVNDTDSDEMKLLLRKEIRALREAIKEEEGMLSFYQQEREKINYNWIICKKDLEDLRSELINKEKEIADLQENHMMTLNLYKQKIKHQLFQNQDEQTSVKKDVEIKLKHSEDEHRLKQRELKFDIRSLNVQHKEQELNQNEYLFALQMDFNKKMTLIRQEHERQAMDIKRKYDLKMQKLRTEMEEARSHQIKQIEDKKEAAVKDLTAKHFKKYTDIKNYYQDITATNLELIKHLKGQIAKLQKSDDTDKKLLAQVEAENKKLKDPLNALTEEIKMLNAEEKEYEELKKKKDIIKEKIKEQEHKFRKMEFEYEVKLQQFKYLEREKNSLVEKFNEAVYEIQAKTGLKNLLLEKQVAYIKDNIEIKELQINQLDPNLLGEINRTIEEAETAKNDLINELQRELQQIRKAHTHMVKAYEAKLAEFVIPVEELGFDPLVPTNTD